MEGEIMPDNYGKQTVPDDKIEVNIILCLDEAGGFKGARLGFTPSFVQVNWHYERDMPMPQRFKP